MFLFHFDYFKLFFFYCFYCDTITCWFKFNCSIISLNPVADDASQLENLLLSIIPDEISWFKHRTFWSNLSYFLWKEEEIYGQISKTLDERMQTRQTKEKFISNHNEFFLTQEYCYRWCHICLTVNQTKWKQCNSYHTFQTVNSSLLDEFEAIKKCKNNLSDASQSEFPMKCHNCRFHYSYVAIISINIEY